MTAKKKLETVCAERGIEIEVSPAYHRGRGAIWVNLLAPTGKGWPDGDETNLHELCNSFGYQEALERLSDAGDLRECSKDCDCREAVNPWEDPEQVEAEARRLAREWLALWEDSKSWQAFTEQAQIRLFKRAWLYKHAIAFETST
jgi:hypothetical protein